ncbi:hypothetical protein R3Q06_34765 [Rhodococcus erythropolis]|uniref:hypothetical protein n=1 Tax=Rhodococcus erythropolis TaxID=1833 RepID=UPI002949EE46|nr:hypothetical protein [Rhodococcus erythropolis]MDV6278561.1 hypothetical protein [Rhodococcus erythropolis]
MVDVDLCPNLEPQDNDVTLSDILEKSRRVLAHSMHRDQIALRYVERIVDDTNVTLPALPTVWTIDKDLLPKHVRTKLLVRTAAGLSNPVHADGASEIVARTARPGRNPAVTSLISTPLQDGAELSVRQKRALHQELTFDVPGGSIEVPRGRFGEALSVMETRRNRTDGTINIAPLTVLVLSVAILVAGGAIPGLVALASTVSLIWWANHKRANSIELVSEDYRAMEVATVPLKLSDTRSRECRLAQLTYALCQETERRKIWGSDLLQDEVRIDTKNEIYQVTKQAARICEIRRKTQYEQASRDTDPDRILKLIRYSIQERVAALFRYAAALSELNNIFIALHGVVQASETDLDPQDLLDDSGVDEISASNTRISADTLRHKSEIISAQIELMSGILAMGNVKPGMLGGDHT